MDGDRLFGTFGVSGPPEIEPDCATGSCKSSRDGDIFSADLTPQLQIPVRDWRVCLDTEYLSGRFEWVSKLGSTIVRPDGCSTFGRRLEEQTCAVTSRLHPSFFTDIENRHSRAPGLPRAAVLGLDLSSMGTMWWDGDVQWVSVNRPNIETNHFGICLKALLQYDHPKCQKEIALSGLHSFMHWVRGKSWFCLLKVENWFVIKTGHSILSESKLAQQGGKKSVPSESPTTRCASRLQHALHRLRSWTSQRNILEKHRVAASAPKIGGFIRF
ncbi:hypothetical protein B0H13DRAFT_2528764 [Mycena leptocephala]|nr:hypothetical protein B0H13DRAFT_2528764 [Mycena leptocephala]